ncbi:MAG TPA: NAD(P)-dependent oxidoreductase [Bryobacteraceae bacterium]|nr:NAD(P)-dependent oxidoreductase [Bryobacteraceae bacterium]
MAKLGFLGLGIMGYPMARHLLQAGHEVALWSHQGAKARELAKEGKGAACSTPKEVAGHADYIFYCVGDSAMSREVALGKNGLIEAARKDALIADCSTISPGVSREIGAAFASKGVAFLDAPCTGSKSGAEKATLTFMIGGDKAAVERAKPYFEIMGKLFYYCGGPGQGLQAKLTQNLILGSLYQAFAEGMVLAVKGGVKPELMLEILDNSAAKSGLISAKAPYVLARDFQTQFSTKWLHKDISLALESAKGLDVPMPVTALTQQMLQAAIAKGLGEEDFCSSIRVLEEWASVEVRKA